MDASGDVKHGSKNSVRTLDLANFQTQEGRQVHFLSPEHSSALDKSDDDADPQVPLCQAGRLLLVWIVDRLISLAGVRIMLLSALTFCSLGCFLAFPFVALGCFLALPLMTL